MTTNENQLDRETVHEAWGRSCRVDDLLSRFDPPPPSLHLVEAILDRAKTKGGQPPDAVLAGYAAGLAAPQWAASGEVVQRQIGQLMLTIADSVEVDSKVLAHVHMVVSTAAAQLSLAAWQAQAQTDELTRLSNSFALDTDLNRLANDGEPVRIGFIDLNGLKSVNDAEGHEAGDRLIKRFADHLNQRVRDAGGRAYRPHGDEFVVTMLLSSGTVDDSLQALSETGEFSFSWGCAEWPSDDPDIQTVVRRADKAIYDMKTIHRKKRAEEAERQSEGD